MCYIHLIEIHILASNVGIYRLLLLVQFISVKYFFFFFFCTFMVRSSMDGLPVLRFTFEDVKEGF